MISPEVMVVLFVAYLMIDGFANIIVGAEEIYCWWYDVTKKKT